MHGSQVGTFEYDFESVLSVLELLEHIVGVFPILFACLSLALSQEHLAVAGLVEFALPQDVGILVNSPCRLQLKTRCDVVLWSRVRISSILIALTSISPEFAMSSVLSVRIVSSYPITVRRTSLLPAKEIRVGDSLARMGDDVYM